MTVDTSAGHAAMDYREHERTYSGFVHLVKYMVIASVLLLIGMAYFLL